MKSIVLSQYIGNIDDRLIQEADVFANKKQSKPISKKFITILVAAILVLALTTAALAATGVIDFASVFSNLFRNETVAPYIIDGDNISGNVDVHLVDADNDTDVMDDQSGDIFRNNESEIDIKLLAAVMDDTQGGGLFLKFEIHDPTGERLSDSFVLINNNENMGLTPLNMNITNDMRQWIDSGTEHVPDGVQVIDEYTVHAGFFIPGWLMSEWGPLSRNEAGDIVVQFDYIASGIKETTVNTELNVGQHLGLTAPVALPGVEFVQIMGVEISREHPQDERELLRIFHEDTRSDPLLYGWGAGLLSLRKADGGTIGLSGQADHNQMLTDITGFESMFNINDIDPNDLTLIWRGDMAEHIIPGNWEFTISTGNVAIQAGEFHGLFDGMRTEVNVNTTGVRIYIYDAPDFNTAGEMARHDSPLILHMADGTTIDLPEKGAAEGGTDVILIAYYFDFLDIDFINPEDVVRVTFRGVEIGD